MKNPESKKGAEKTYGNVESRISKSLPVIMNTRDPKIMSAEGRSSWFPSSMCFSSNTTLIKLPPAGLIVPKRL
jgi:hypothetical protein